MSFDNKIFDVNGSGESMLKLVLELAYKQHGERTQSQAWRFVPEVGFVLLWHHSNGDGSNAFPCQMSFDAVTPMVVQWLKSDQAQSMKFEGWNANADHDGDNSMGWRVSVGDWGKVAGNTYAICVIRPVYLWHGK